MYTTILFDLDGTLIDSEAGITRCVTYALEKLGIHETNQEILKKFIGPPLMDSFQEFYHLTKSQAYQAVQYYRERFDKKGAREYTVYPGISKLLAKLKEQGLKLGVASSKQEEAVRKILDHSKLSSYFDIIAGSDEVKGINQKEDVIEEALKRFQVTDAKEVLMVGDRKFDVIGASMHHIACIGFLQGFGSIEELKEAKAKWIVKGVPELETLLMELTTE